MPFLTLVTTCKGRLDHLRQSLPLMAHQADVQCVLVDYNCPQGAADWTGQNLPQVKTLRVPDATEFNLGKARNLGADLCATPYIGFVDCDVLLSPDFHRVAESLLAEKIYLRSASSTHDIAGLVVCAFSDFSAAGGYDETFEGWGAEDTDFYLRLELVGCTKRTLAPHLAQALPHLDTLRTRFHAVSDRFLSLRINSLYLQAKIDLARHLGVLQLPLAHRQSLYAEIRRVITADPDATAQLAVTLPAATEATTPPGWNLSRRWVYQYDPEALKV